MPASDLKELREFVANILDYNPENENYAKQVDALLNQADSAICQEKPFTFVNKVVDVPVYKDVAIPAATCTNGTQVVTAPLGTFLSWMVGQELAVTLSTGSVETFTINNVVSDTDVRIDRDFTDTTGAKAAVVINRYIDLPADATTILAVARRSDTLSPTDPGLLENLARFEDEWWNLPLGEVNLPINWVWYDAFHLRGPRRNFGLTTAVAVGRGVRTLEFCSTLVFAGRESAHGEVVSITAQATEDIVLTPFVQTTNSGLYKRYYWRAPDFGYKAWRLLDDALAPGSSMTLAPTDVAPRTYAFDTTSMTTTEGLFNSARMANPDGFTQRIRLYPRQDKDYNFQVRYMVKHQDMQEDNDVSLIPPENRMIIAYKALADVLAKHDNPTQAEMYKRKFNVCLLQLERRYLITPSKRIVKGDWGADTGFRRWSRFSALVHS